MTLAQHIKRPFVWLARFRHRRGYGVHSPFAFEFITRVIYERAPYYQYAGLALRQREEARQRGKEWAQAEPLRVKKLLFRLVNRAQPACMVDVGVSSAASLYLSAACRKAELTQAATLNDLFLDAGVPVDFLYLHAWRDAAMVEETFRVCASRAGQRSMFVVQGIGYSQAMRECWKRMVRHPQVGITFDLYDVGILLFDHSLTKQDYIVNF